MDENEKFIRENVASLLVHPQVKAKTNGGQWSLVNDECPSFWPTPRNIEFSAVLQNGAKCVRVKGTINRATAKFSNVTVYEM